MPKKHLDDQLLDSLITMCDRVGTRLKGLTPGQRMQLLSRMLVATPIRYLRDVDREIDIAVVMDVADKNKPTDMCGGPAQPPDDPNGCEAENVE